MNLTEEHDVQRVLRAAVFAAEKHAGQRRKGEAGEPYINHLLEVAQLVSTSPATTTDAVTAALLHDVVEDTPVTATAVEAAFGPDVTGMVLEVTDDKTLPEAERKRRQVEHAPSLSGGAGLIKLADKISNLRGILLSPPAGWSAERKRAYAVWGGEVVAGIRSPDPALLAEFERLQGELLRQLEKEQSR